ncbi:hypothetical protein QVD17_31057 [Tagetes erecta]|uniref:Cytochrome P450 n=1 Tax=Tagetes erecta TaxID=13708 RepID=A0AAD8NN23_TARER|nr:hypothetical protein QVD17_31057 [Tagetes erecta]
MDLTNVLRDCNLLSSLFVLSTIFFILVTKLFFNKRTKNLPPGPPQLPIIGNLHQVGDKPHVSLTNFAKKYGPLMSLRLGKQLLVVASSPETAREILKTHDKLLSARPVPTSFKLEDVLPNTLVWSDCNQTWKTLRALCRTELFSPKALEAQYKLRMEKICQLSDFLRKKQGEVIDVQNVVFTTLFNTLSSIILGKDLLDLNDEDKASKGFKESLLKVIEFAGRPKDLGSFFPFLERFDVEGIRRENNKHVHKTFSYWEGIIEERRVQVNSSTWSSEQAQSFIDILLEKKFSNDQINEFILELFAAGTNTTTCTVIWAMRNFVAKGFDRIFNGQTLSQGIFVSAGLGGMGENLVGKSPTCAEEV